MNALEQALEEIDALKEELYHLNDDFTDAKRRILFLENRGIVTVTVTKKIESIRDITTAERNILSLTKARHVKRENIKRRKEELKS